MQTGLNCVKLIVDSNGNLLEHDMGRSSLTRRSLLRSTALGGTLLALPQVFSWPQAALGQERSRTKVERLGVGAIGLRYQGTVDALKAQIFGDIVAVCDVDRHVRDQAKAAFGSTPYSCEDYQELLTREDWKVYDYDNLERPARKGKLDAIINHMGNFFDCIQSRRVPISDVESQHRSVSTCHLGNISMHLGRTLKWDPSQETFVGDQEANAMLKREQRNGFAIS